MKMLWRAVGMLIVLGLFSSSGWCAQKLSPGEAVLQKAARAYQELKTYQAEVATIVNMTMQGMEQKISIQSRLVIERPNRLAILAKTEGMFGNTCISDGTKVYTYLPMFKKYTVKDAPGDFSEFLYTMGPVLQFNSFTFQCLVTLLKPDPYKELMEGVDKIQLLDRETVDGAKTIHLLLSQKVGVELELWVDAKSYLIRKFRTDMSKMMEKAGGEMNGEMGGLVSGMKMVIEETHHQIKVNGEVPKEVYVFTPPEGVQKVDEFFAGTGEEKPSPLTGKNAQDFTLGGMKEGTSFHLADYKGKVVLLDFWASWCPPCRQELPILQQVWDKYKDKNFIFIAVNAGEDRKTVEEFIAEKGFTFSVALDTEFLVGKTYGVEAYPTLVMIDKKGKIQKVHCGFMPGIKNTLEKEIGNLLEGKPLTEEKTEGSTCSETQCTVK